MPIIITSGIITSNKQSPFVMNPAQAAAIASAQQSTPPTNGERIRLRNE